MKNGFFPHPALSFPPQQIYESGMQYGWHVDSPVMGNPPVRTDLAMTL